MQPWTEKDLANILRIRLPLPKEALAVLQLQGYIEPGSKSGTWRVTEQGEIVSGAKAPRFTPPSIAAALAGLRDRIKTANENPTAAYRITEAVAFGDFLRDAVLVQAADVGVRLVPKSGSGPIASAQERAAELELLLARAKPLIPGVGLTLRTMPVPTRVIRDGLMPAAVALIAMTTERGRAAARDGVEDLNLWIGQGSSIAIQKSIAAPLNDIGHLPRWTCHHSSLESPSSLSKSRIEI